MGCGCLALLFGFPLVAAVIFALDGHFGWFIIAMLFFFNDWGQDD